MIVVSFHDARGWETFTREDISPKKVFTNAKFGCHEPPLSREPHGEHDLCSFAQAALDDALSADGREAAGHIFQAVTRGEAPRVFAGILRIRAGIETVAVVLDGEF